MTNTIIIFTICSLLNVMLNTVKTIVMYNKNKLSSSLINAITYGFYTIIVVLMAGSMPLTTKIIITAVTNFVGVWLSMVILAKFEKDKLWEIRTTFRTVYVDDVKVLLNKAKIEYTYITTENTKYTVFNIYSNTQAESLAIKEIIKKYNAKYFVNESKTL